MADTVQAAPVEAQGPGKSVAARMIGVIISPGEAMREIVAKPNALPPFAVYLVILCIMMMVYGMRAHWDVIMTDQIENSPFWSFVPDAQKDTILAQQVAELKKQTQTQLALGNTVNVMYGATFFFHGMGLIYATLFVLMGSLTALKLGRAWLRFGLCILLLVAGIIVYVVADRALGRESQSATMLIVTSSILCVGGWLWLMASQARTDVSWHQILSVCTYAGTIACVGAIVFTVITLVNPASAEISFDKMVKSNVGSWVKLGIPILDALLRSLDVFTLWMLAVMTIGFKAATRLSGGLAATITFLPWGIIVLIRLAWAAATGS